LLASRGERRSSLASSAARSVSVSALCLSIVGV
jgi:hypothetical protein